MKRAIAIAWTVVVCVLLLGAVVVGWLGLYADAFAASVLALCISLWHRKVGVL